MSTLDDPRRWLIGPLAPYAACVVLAPDSAAEQQASTLLTADGIERALAPYAALHPGAPKRALVSQWLKRYLASLLIPQVGLLSIANWRLPQSLEASHLRLNERGEVVSFRYAGSGAPLPAELPVAERWNELLHAHLDPLIVALARYGRISQRVLWNNVGNLLEAIFGQLAKLPKPLPGLAADRSLLIEAAEWALPGEVARSRRNPMRDPVHYVPSLMPATIAEPTRLRRHCCLRHEIPGVVYCATCPHLTELNRTELDALLEQWHHED